MSKSILAIVFIIIVVGLGFWVYSLIATEKLTVQEQACVDSGGEVVKSLCCKTTGDFPNLCLIGSCGCSLGNSHYVKVCDCGSDKCFNGEKCISSDEISVLLEEIKQETGIDFSDIRESEFKWIVAGDLVVKDTIVEGKGFEAERISVEQYNSVGQLLEDNGFEKDIYNIAAGTVSELNGYKKDQIVCAVGGGFSGYQETEGQWIPPETDKYNIIVECGILEVAFCDISTPCSQGEECYKFEDEDFSICWSGNPCRKCPSGECNIAESYPMQVFCK